MHYYSSSQLLGGFGAPSNKIDTNKNKTQILIITPGRLLDLILNYNL